jgi:ketosteroid isomerase-like protein
MPTLLRAPVLILLLAFVSACATARCRPADPQADLLDFEHRWVDALLRKDVRALGALLADDFQDNAYNGNVYTRKEILARIAAGGPTYPSLGLTETRVRVYGTAGVVTGVNTVKTDGAPVRVRFTDVFRRQGCGWRAVSAQETPIPAAPSQGSP